MNAGGRYRCGLYNELMAPGLYIHVPFCRSRCNYCDFYRVVYRTNSAERYLRALAIELGLLPAGFVPGTIYVGGGTPSVLSESELGVLLGLLEPLRRPGQEFTFEMNPESVTPGKVRLLSRAGVSRASLGVQSFSPAALVLLGRPHGVEDAVGACRFLKEAIPDLSVDLIFAIPGQDLPEWEDTMARAVGLAPEHISVYSLAYEPGSELAGRLERGKLEAVREEIEREMFLRAIRFLGSQGYEHYEVSNFSRPGHRSRHNEAYWSQEDYIGVGPGACSTLARDRRRFVGGRTRTSKSSGGWWER